MSVRMHGQALGFGVQPRGTILLCIVGFEVWLFFLIRNLRLIE